MITLRSEHFQYPSTRYSGSKRRLLDWIWENVKSLRFRSVLDAFGGTASVSLMFKRHGKRVFFNDLLDSSQIIGTAIIQNSSVRVADHEIDDLLRFAPRRSRSAFIQKNFKKIFYLDEENACRMLTLTTRSR